ncbi:MAG: hypothetical protein JNK49_17175 [Planctomycetes bacterium]|nr:hypothetical protein [Planctomycetota bacterium]
MTLVHDSPRGAAAVAPATAGFTLLELTVVMGILSGFLVMLVQLVDAGLTLFGEGEASQALADRAARAEQVLGRELQALRGGCAEDVVDDRLLVQYLPIGLPARPEPQATFVQVLRGAVHLTADRELPLRELQLRLRLQQESPNLTPEDLDREVAKAMHTEPLAGLGTVLLVPWRQEGEDEGLLELRAAWFLPRQTVPVGDRDVDPMAVPVPGQELLPGTAVYQYTAPILQDLLHVEFRFWSQRTRQWSASGAAGPEMVWDSARGGVLVDAQNGGVFELDRGEASLQQAHDDIHPHAILVRCVVAEPAGRPAEGLLAATLERDGQSLTLVLGERFPGSTEGGWAKVGREWLRYEGRSGDTLFGLRRGLRGTRALEHVPGTRVHIGREVEFVIPLAHAKDDWHG